MLAGMVFAIAIDVTSLFDGGELEPRCATRELEKAVVAISPNVALVAPDSESDPIDHVRTED
jgi:hypothetical protein